MVSGRTGSGWSSPSASALTTGAQPEACVHVRQLALGQPDFRELAEAAEDARQERSARDWRHHVIRITPSELFDDLEAHGLGAFRVVGAKVDVDETPAIPIAHLRAQPVHIVVVAGDGEDRRPIDRRTKELARLEIVGDKHTTLDAETRGVRRDAVGEVAGRRASQHVEAQLESASRGYRHDAVFVRQRRVVHRVVLDVQLIDAEPIGETCAAHERREARMKAGPRFAGNRQQLAVAP